MSNNTVTVTLIEYSKSNNGTLKSILLALNGYLLRNKGGVSDFFLVKDIVDRNLDKLDDGISNDLPTPLYLGLMGTMIGVVIGLVFMPELPAAIMMNGNQAMDVGTASEALKTTNNVDFAQGVNALLKGVMIAMVASVIGLLLTIIGNFYFFKARRELEQKKHDFLTFIQTQLLPILTKNTASSIFALQNSLVNFNRDFSTNMGKFSSTVTDVGQINNQQLDVLRELKKIDIAKLAKFNIEVSNQLQGSFGKLNELSVYLESMNGFIENTRNLNFAVNKQLERVGDISQLVQRFDHNASHISESSNYLKSHFREIDQREQAINDRLASFDRGTGDMIELIRESFEKRLQEFNDKDVEISSGFKKMFEDLREMTKKVFEDESGNIHAIKNKVEDLNGISGELSTLKDRVSDQDGSLRELLEIIKDTPSQVKIPSTVNIAIVIFAIIGSLTCLGILTNIFFTV